jgi:hypothetical protein
MTDGLRSLLTDVAEGRVDPAEAARRLSGVDAPAGAVPTADPWAGATADPDATAPASSGGSTGATGAAATSSTAASEPAAGEPRLPSGSDPVDRVVVQASARPVRVVADPTVATLTVDGPHTVRRDGGTVRVEVPVTPSSDGPGSYRYERKAGLSRWISQATLLGVPLTVRLNPDLPLEVEVMAGSVDITGLRSELTFSVTAGSLKATDCTGPVVGTVSAGSARLDVRPTSGRSHIRAESGSVDLRLQPGSDVRVTARAELGEVKIKALDGSSSTKVVQGDGAHEVVLGSGTALVEVDVVMGSVKVRTP